MTSYNLEEEEEFWDEIPYGAFMALGRRGRELINLHECFTPNCDETNRDKLHPLKSENVTIPGDDDTWEKQQRKFLIYCEKCEKKFNLVFESHHDLKIEDTKDPDDNIIMERVFATDESGDKNFGEIGFIQPR